MSCHVMGPIWETPAPCNWVKPPPCAVCGKCSVLTPAQADRRPGSSAAYPDGPAVFVCSRRYLPGGRGCALVDAGVGHLRSGGSTPPMRPWPAARLALKIELLPTPPAGERRVAPLDDGVSGVTLQAALQEKPHSLVAHCLLLGSAGLPGAERIRRAGGHVPPGLQCSGVC